MGVNIDTNLDKLLKILENPIRRKIIERLSQEPNYTLRLSKELGLGQQLVAKHLKVMEESGLVKSKTQDSPSGPQRRVFGLAKSLSITVDVAPHLFKQDIVFFDFKSKQPKIPEPLESLIERKKNIDAYSDWKNKLKPYATLLSEIDSKLELIEKKRVHLLSIRNLIMRDVSTIIQNIRDTNTRRVFHLALDEHDQSIRRISQALNLREEIVQQVIQKIKNDFETEFFK